MFFFLKAVTQTITVNTPNKDPRALLIFLSPFKYIFFFDRHEGKKEKIFILFQDKRTSPSANEKPKWARLAQSSKRYTVGWKEKEPGGNEKKNISLDAHLPQFVEE
jgi:hypothetical protein